MSSARARAPKRQRKEKEENGKEAKEVKRRDPPEDEIYNAIQRLRAPLRVGSSMERETITFFVRQTLRQGVASSERRMISRMRAVFIKSLLPEVREAAYRRCEDAYQLWGWILRSSNGMLNGGVHYWNDRSDDDKKRMAAFAAAIPALGRYQAWVTIYALNSEILQFLAPYES